MKSKQKSTKADAKEEAAESSTKSNIYVEAEYNVDESEKKQGDRPPQIQRPTNPQVLSDSSNKFGSQKERQDPQQMMKKKKKFGPRNKTKNKNAWNSNIDKTETDDSHYQRSNHNNHVHRQHRDAEKIGTVTDNDYHPNASQNNDRYHYRDIKTQRNDTGRHVRSNDKHHGRHHHNWNRHRRQANNREFVSHGEVVSNPSGFQPPFLQYDPDSRFPFPTQTPQQQQMFAADGEAKNLLEHDEYNDQNGNSSAWNNSIPLFTFPLDSWTDLIDSNTQIQGVLLSNDGNPPTVATLPSDVGDHLVKELLMQKEISKNHDKNNRGPTWNTSNKGEQKRLSKGKMSTGATNQGVASPAVPFIQHGSVQSMSTSSRDVLLPSSVHQSNASEYGPHYGIYDPNSYHMQPHNGYVSFPSHEVNFNFSLSDFSLYGNPTDHLSRITHRIDL